MLKELHCSAQGIVIGLEGEKRGVKLEAQVRLQIKELSLTESTQILLIQVIDEKRPTGRNLLGKIVCGVGATLVGDLTNFALKNCDLGDYIHYDDKQKLITVSLGAIPDVQRLLQPVHPSWKESAPLRFLDIKEGIHVSGGVELRLAVAPELWAAKEGLNSVAETAKGLLSCFTKS